MDGIPKEASHVHLLNIAAEIRLLIFDELIQLPKVKLLEGGCSCPVCRKREAERRSVHTQLMGVNRQLLGEFAHHLYGNRVISFDFPIVTSVIFFYKGDTAWEFMTKVELRGLADEDFQYALSRLQKTRNLSSLTLGHDIICKDFAGVLDERDEFSGSEDTAEEDEPKYYFARFISEIMENLVNIVKNRVLSTSDQAPEQAAEMVRLDRSSLCCGYAADFEVHFQAVEKGLRAEIVWMYHFEKETLAYNAALAELEKGKGASGGSYRQRDIWSDGGVMQREQKARLFSGTTFLV